MQPSKEHSRSRRVRVPSRVPKDLFGFLVRNHYTRDTLFSSIFRMQRICKGQNTLPSPLLYVTGLNCKVTLGLFSGFSWEQDVYGKPSYLTCVCEMRPKEKKHLKKLQGLPAWASCCAGVGAGAEPTASLQWHRCCPQPTPSWCWESASPSIL